MLLRGKKLGVLIASAPGAPNFERGLKLAEAALSEGVLVYLYCIDEAVVALDDSRIQNLRRQGLNLFACAYGAQRREMILDDRATFAGLTVLHDLIAATDRFVAFS